MKMRIVALIALIALSGTVQSSIAFADTPTPEQAQRYLQAMRYILDCSERQDTGALQSVCTPLMSRFLNGEGSSPIFQAVNKIGQIGDVECVYISGQTATITVAGSGANAYFNLSLTDDGKAAGWSIHFYKSGDDILAPMPVKTYRATVDAIVVDITNGDYGAIENMLTPRGQVAVPLAAMTTAIQKISVALGSIADVSLVSMGSDIATYRLKGTTGSEDVNIALTSDGSICVLLFHTASGDDPSTAVKPPSEVTPAVRRFADAVNHVDVNGFESLLADDVAAQVPPDKAFTFLKSLHAVTGDLSNPNYQTHAGDQYVYSLTGTNGDIDLALTPDVDDRFTWLAASLIDDDSPAAKAHLTLPDLKLKRPGE